MNEIEVLLQKLFEPPKKGNDHCGNPSQVLKTASKAIELLLKARVYNAQSGELTQEDQSWHYHMALSQF